MPKKNRKVVKDHGVNQVAITAKQLLPKDAGVVCYG